MPSAATRPLFEAREIARHRLLSRLCRAGERERRDATATTPRSWWTRTPRSSASTARCICPATPTTRAHSPFQHLEKRYFEPGDLGFPVWRAFGGNRRHVHLQRPALAGDLPGHGHAGRRADSARLQHADAPSAVGAGLRSPRRLSTTTCACRPAPTRTAPGWSASPRPATRREASCSPAAASSRPRARSWRGDDQGRRWRSPAATSICAARYKDTMFNFDLHRQPDAYGASSRARARV